MSNFVICSKNLLGKTSNKASYKAFFSIPVSPIKTILTYTEKFKLNHFERAIISLLINDFYTTEELSEILTLDIELIELIVDDMIKKEYITKNYTVPKKTEELLKDTGSILKTKIGYLLYDYNRGQLLPGVCSPNELVILPSSRNSFSIETDAYDEKISYTPVIVESKYKVLSDSVIEELLKKNVMNYLESDLRSVKVIEYDYKMYDLVGYVETDLIDSDISRWNVKNPITFEGDASLQGFFEQNRNNKGVSTIIQNLMAYRRQKASGLEESKLRDIVRNKLFSKPLGELHESLVDPLIKIVKSLKFQMGDDGDYDRFYSKANLVKSAIINLPEMFEKILYQAAYERTLVSKNYLNIDSLLRDLKRDRNQNADILEGYAKIMGFNVENENAYNMLKISKHGIKSIIGNPLSAKINECIAYNLIIGHHDKNYFINKFSKECPMFIKLMSVLKNKYRDVNRHSTKVESITPKEYVTLLFKLLECAFGYKLKEQAFDELMNSNDVMVDYSEEYEYLLSKMGNKFTSNREEVTTLKVHLINMYCNYHDLNSGYLSSARAIVEDLLKYCLDTMIKNYKVSFSEGVLDIFDSAEAYVEFLKKCSFETVIPSVIGGELIGALNVNPASNENVIKGFSNGFDKANLRIKLQSLIICVYLNNDCKKLLLDNYKNLFIIISEIMYMDRLHQQNHIFDKEKATIIVNDVIDLTSKLINDEKVLDLEL